jgi:hypothetical protein
MEHMLVVDDGVLMRQGEPFDCALDVRVSKGAPDRRIIAETYAADKYGNLFSKPIKGFNGTFFNHSSYCADKEVMCAGTIACKDGKLLYISNLSGHYKQTPAHLASVLLLLADEDVDLTDVLVTAVGVNGTRQAKATSLIRSPSTANDWTVKIGNDVAVKIDGDSYIISNPQ